MNAFAVGYMPEGENPFSQLSPEEQEKLWRAGRLNWKGETVPIQLAVELPFWLLVEDCDLDITYQQSTVKTEVHGHYVEVVEKATYLDSKRNLVWMGPESQIRTDDPYEATTAGIAQPVVRFLKTVIIFHSGALADAIQGLKDGSAGKFNNCNNYFESLAFAHIPFLNNLIRSYRFTSHDPFAFEVSEWDVPLWWARSEDKWIRIGLMNYWDNDRYPEYRDFSTGEHHQFHATRPEAVQKQITQDAPVGKLELLDALS